MDWIFSDNVQFHFTFSIKKFLKKYKKKETIQKEFIKEILTRNGNVLEEWTP